MREGRLTDEFRARTKSLRPLSSDFLCSCPKNAMKSKFVQGRCFAPAHLSRPTLGKLRGLVLKPSSSRNSVERSRKRMRLNCGLNFYEKNAALIARARHRLNKKLAS